MSIGLSSKGILYIASAHLRSINHLIFVQSAQMFMFGTYEPNDNALLASITKTGERSRLASIFKTMGGLLSIPATTTPILPGETQITYTVQMAYILAQPLDCPLYKVAIYALNS